jgi:hypothetical protein
MFRCECGEELILVVKEEQITQYEINEDGNLEVWDSDGTGQMIYLQCKECDKKYEFENNMLAVEDRPKIVHLSMRSIYRTRLADVRELTIKPKYQ